MSISTVKSMIARDISNLPGWATKRKMVIIESDDWGSIRMPSIDACKKLIAAGLDLEGGSQRYNYNDTLADKNDLTALFETLEKHKDKDNRPAVFTAVSIVANPDFKKIKEIIESNAKLELSDESKNKIISTETCCNAETCC